MLACLPITIRTSGGLWAACRSFNDCSRICASHLRELDDGSLGGVVGSLLLGVGDVAWEGGHAAGVDDLAAADREHVASLGLAAVEDAVRVDVESGSPLLRRSFLAW